MTGAGRRLILGAGVLAVVAGFLVARAVRPMVDVGTAYTAKSLCSEVFVAGHGADEVMRVLPIDDLRALRWMSATVDTTSRTATARLFLFGTRIARHDESSWCVLSPAGEMPVTNAETRSGIPRGSSAAWPRESRATGSAGAGRSLAAVLEDAFVEVDPSRPRRTRAIVVLQHGSVVGERYAPGIEPDTPLPGWSMTKSVVNALVGIAVRQGLLTLDDVAGMPEWSAPGDARGEITVDDLLHMSSGLRFDEGQANPTSDLFRMLYHAGDMAAVALNQPLEARPGTRWQYSSGTTLILSRLLRDVLGEERYRRFPRAALFEPIGMTRAVLEADASGTLVASSYMYATAREWARFGQLYLQDGVWNGERLLPEGWVHYTRTPAPAAPGSIYGAHFWLRTPKEYRGPATVLPAGIFQAVGHEGQFVTVIPSHDAVIVRLGRTRYPDAWSHDRFVAAVLATLRPGLDAAR